MINYSLIKKPFAIALAIVIVILDLFVDCKPPPTDDSNLNLKNLLNHHLVFKA